MTRDEALTMARERLYAMGRRLRKGSRGLEASWINEEIADLAIDLDPTGVLGRPLSSPCACGGREPIDVDYEATLYHDYDDLYHLDANLSKRLPLLRPRQKVKAHVLIFADEEGKSWRCSGCGATSRRGCICFGDV